MAQQQQQQKTKYEKAQKIFATFEQRYNLGKISSAEIKAKMASQAGLTETSAATYFYLCKSKAENTSGKQPKKAVAKKTRR